MVFISQERLDEKSTFALLAVHASERVSFYFHWLATNNNDRLSKSTSASILDGTETPGYYHSVLDRGLATFMEQTIFGSDSKAYEGDRSDLQNSCLLLIKSRDNSWVTPHHLFAAGDGKRPIH